MAVIRVNNIFLSNKLPEYPGKRTSSSCAGCSRYIHMYRIILSKKNLGDNYSCWTAEVTTVFSLSGTGSCITIYEDDVNIMCFFLYLVCTKRMQWDSV
jgi:hypothetical protein